MNERTPYMTVRQVSEYLPFIAETKHPMLNAWRWLKRHQVPMVGHGRKLVLRSSVIEALTPKRKTHLRRVS